jgi:hypothetical protein
MIWTPARNTAQGLLVAQAYQRAADVPCERLAVMAAGLRGANKGSALAQSGVDRSRYFTVSVDTVLEDMAVRGLIPHVDGLSPMEAADLVHAEAQFLAKRLALRALTDRRNLILDITMASLPSVESWVCALRGHGYTVSCVFVDMPVAESARRSDDMHRAEHEEYRRGRGHGGRLIPPEAIHALAAGPPGRRPGRPGQPARALGADTAAGAADTIVTALLTAYRCGQLTLGQLAGEFRRLPWRTVPPTCPPDLAAAAPAVDDLEPYMPGSFDDVVRAYDAGLLGDDEFAVLAPAAAQAGQPAGLRRPGADATAEPGPDPQDRRRP